MDTSAVFGLYVVLREGRVVAVLCPLLGVYDCPVLTTLDLRALEIRLLEGVCSLCCWRVSEHLVVFSELLLWSSVGGVVYGGSKEKFQSSSQFLVLFPSGLCRQSAVCRFAFDCFSPV